MDARWTQALRLWLRWLFGTRARGTASRSARPLTPFRTFRPVGPFTFVGTLAPIRSLAIGPLTVSPFGAAGTTVAWPALAAVRSFGAAASDQRGRHELLVTGRGPDDLDALRFVAPLLLDRREADDAHAIEVEIRIGPKDLTDFGTVRHQRCVDDTAGLACARGAPRPRAVTTVARELDVDPARHGERR
jgi:hypothetical protein